MPSILDMEQDNETTIGPAADQFTDIGDLLKQLKAKQDTTDDRVLAWQQRLESKLDQHIALSQELALKICLQCQELAARSSPEEGFEAEPWGAAKSTGAELQQLSMNHAVSLPQRSGAQVAQHSNRRLRRAASTLGNSSHFHRSNSTFLHSPEPTQNRGMAEPLLANDADDKGGKNHNGADSKKSKSYNHVFIDHTEVKSTVEQLLARASHSQEVHFTDTGIWQALARSERFQNATMFVIVLNCIWLAIDTEYDHDDFIWYAPTVFWIVENIFCFIFTAEILIRFNAFKVWSTPFQYGSFIFDAVLVGTMIWDTWIVTLLIICLDSRPSGPGRGATVLRVLRIFRIFRVARVGRFLNRAPDLKVLVKGMLIALRATMSVLTLLAFVIYIFAIVFMQLVRKKPIANGQFSSFGGTMHLLLMQVLCGPDSDLVNDMLDAGFVYYVVFLVYLLIAQLTIMNMLIGILCDVVSEVSETEKEHIFEEELEQFIDEISLQLDADKDGKITKEEFDEIFKDPDTAQAVTSMGMDVVSMSDYAAFIFNEVEDLTYSDLHHMLNQFRESKTVTVKDLMDMRKYLVVELSLH